MTFDYSNAFIVIQIFEKSLTARQPLLNEANRTQSINIGGDYLLYILRLCKAIVMPKIAVQNILRTSPLFSGLTTEEKGEISSTCRTVRYSSGQMLFSRNDIIRQFYIVCDGVVQIFRYSPDGRETTAEVFIAGDVIGETEILRMSSMHTYSARTIKNSLLMEFPASWLTDTVKRHGGLALNLLGVISRRSAYAALEYEQKKTLSAAQQVACFLERLCIVHNFDPRGFKLPYSKTLMASRLGIELESFSRALATLREHGLSVKGRHVSFENLQQLASFVCADCSLNDACQEQEALRQKLAVA